MQIIYEINKSAIINSLPLFSDLSFFQKRFIEARCQIVEVKKGDIVYREGSPPDYFYCMVSGRVEAYHPRAKTRRERDIGIACVRKGDYFGSISSLTGKSHSVSAKALNDSMLLRITKEDFEHILRKIPRLAVLLSHSLSRRVSPKPFKEIFESNIISIYGADNAAGSSLYAKELADILRQESGKKVLLIRSGSLLSPEEVSSKLSLLTGDYHYVLVDVTGMTDKMSFEILRQSDICHIVSLSDEDSLKKTSLLLRCLNTSFGRYATQDLFVILREDSLYFKTSYQHKTKHLARDVFATLPKNSVECTKSVRRIARETAGVMTGLALGSGAAIGLGHIGVLKVLEKEKIPIDVISGTSIGALIGALWAAGFSAAEIEKLACSFKSRLRTLFLADPILPIRGFIKGKVVEKVLKPYLGNKTFRDTKLLLKIVACDIKQRREFIIDKGRLIDAVMASIAIPGVFEPILHGDIQLVDGGIVNPLPISALSKSGVKKIIAVNALPGPGDAVPMDKKKLNIYNVIVHSFQAMEYAIAAGSSQQADVYIHPVPKVAGWHEFYKARLFIKTGEEETRRKLAQIKSLVAQK